MGGGARLDAAYGRARVLRDVRRVIDRSDREAPRGTGPGGGTGERLRGEKADARILSLTHRGLMRSSMLPAARLAFQILPAGLTRLNTNVLSARDTFSRGLANFFGIKESTAGYLVNGITSVALALGAMFLTGEREAASIGILPFGMGAVTGQGNERLQGELAEIAETLGKKYNVSVSPAAVKAAVDLVLTRISSAKSVGMKKTRREAVWNNVALSLENRQDQTLIKISFRFADGRPAHEAAVGSGFFLLLAGFVKLGEMAGSIQAKIRSSMGRASARDPQTIVPRLTIWRPKAEKGAHQIEATARPRGAGNNDTGGYLTPGTSTSRR